MLTSFVLIIIRAPQLETALKEFFQLREMEVPSSEERCVLYMPRQWPDEVAAVLAVRHSTHVQSSLENCHHI